MLYNTYWVRFNQPGFSHSLAVDNTLTLFRAAKEDGVRRVVHVSITNPALDLCRFAARRTNAFERLGTGECF